MSTKLLVRKKKINYRKSCWK